MCATDGGILIDVRLVHSENASSPIAVIVDTSITLTMSKHVANAAVATDSPGIVTIYMWSPVRNWGRCLCSI